MLDPDFVKLDMSLVRGIDASPRITLYTQTELTALDGDGRLRRFPHASRRYTADRAADGPALDTAATIA